MNIKSSCQHCEGHIEFDDAYVGHSVKCPHCFEPTLLSSTEKVPQESKNNIQIRPQTGVPMKEATSSQLEYIRGLGGQPPPNLNVRDASKLITELLNAPDLEQRKKSAREQRKKEAIERVHKPAYYLRKDVEEARNLLAKAGPDEIAEAQESLNDAVFERLEFWKDTFNTPCNMNHMCEQGVKLYLEHGHKLKMPSEERMQRVLDTLDGASNTWDMNDTVSFFLTIEASFPNLVRKHIDLEDLKMDMDWLNYNFRA